MIFDDWLAEGLAGEDAIDVEERLRAGVPSEYVAAFVRWVSARTRFTEDQVEQAVARGTDQYVILGAGLDSFAYRRSDLLDSIRVFEVDHPASQAWKRDRLAALGVEVPANLDFVKVDFEHSTLRDGLDASRFDVTRPAIFSWIGVTMYLTPDAISATFDDLAGTAPGSHLVLTYNQPPGTVDAFSSEVTSSFMVLTRKWGEPFVSFFSPDEVQALVQRHGFLQVADFGADEARDAYFMGDKSLQIAGAQRISASTLLATV